MTKEFAYAVIQKMKDQQIDLYDNKILDEYKDNEDQFVEAYDMVLQ